MNQFKHSNWWRSYLGELSKDFGRLQAWISSGNTSTSHGNTISQGEATKWAILQGDFLHGVKFGHFAPWRNHLAKFHKVDLGTLRNAKFSQGGFSPCEIWTLHLSSCENAFEIPYFETLLMIFHCRFSKIFCLIFSFVNTYFTLIINQWKGCFCNSSCNLACYCL